MYIVNKNNGVIKTVDLTKRNNHGRLLQIFVCKQMFKGIVKMGCSAAVLRRLLKGDGF